MRIAYACHWNPFVEDGVVRKIRSQADAWRQFGAEVEIFCLSSEAARPGRPAPLQGQHFLYTSPYAGRARATMTMTRAVGRWSPDIVYLRYSHFLPPPVRMMRATPTVIEINTDDRAEYRHRSRLRAAYNAFNRRVLVREARGLACVTTELARLIVSETTDLPVVQVTNGISLDEGEPLAPAANSRPRLVFLGGAPEPWHGLDKVTQLAVALPEFDFDLIGVQGREEWSPPNVRFHAFCERPKYEAILAASDVALGTLALHRKGMSEAAPLKVREYLLRGIPLILGYTDPDLADDPWFVFQLPNAESNVRDSVREIRDFVRSVAGRRIARAEVADRIDILVKERERLDFLESLVGSNVAASTGAGPARSLAYEKRYGSPRTSEGRRSW